MNPWQQLIPPQNRAAYQPGDVVGSWTLLRYLPANKSTRAPRTDSRWLCRCQCGAESEIRTYILRAGKSRSCRTCAPRVRT